MNGNAQTSSFVRLDFDGVASKKFYANAFEIHIETDVNEYFSM
jgi:hypothetical protein